VPDSIDGAFVFRFDNLEYALKLSYQDDSIEVVRIVTLDTLPAAVLAERKSAYFRISAMGGHIYRPEDYRKIPDLKQQWEAVSRLDILREDFRFVRGWNQYVDSPFLVYTGETVTPMNSRELKNIFLGLYSLF
jgi:hypothetical protein